MLVGADRGEQDRKGKKVRECIFLPSDYTAVQFKRQISTRSYNRVEIFFRSVYLGGLAKLVGWFAHRYTRDAAQN